MGYLGQRKGDQGTILLFRGKSKETRDTLDREEVTKVSFFFLGEKAKKHGIPWTEKR
jgi:hypothetical protein